MTTLDLPEKYRTILIALFQQHIPDTEVWAYGSRVSGQAHATSDLDLVLRNPFDLMKPQDKLITLRETIRESNVPISVDVMDWARIPQSFRNEIERMHVVLYEPINRS